MDKLRVRFKSVILKEIVKMQGISSKSLLSSFSASKFFMFDYLSQRFLKICDQLRVDSVLFIYLFLILKLSNRFHNIEPYLRGLSTHHLLSHLLDWDVRITYVHWHLFRLYSLRGWLLLIELNAALLFEEFAGAVEVIRWDDWFLHLFLWYL